MPVSASAQDGECPASPESPPSLQLDDAPAASNAALPAASRTLTDSLFHDSGDGDYQYTVGYGIPSGGPFGCPVGRLVRFVADIIYTVPADRPGTFSLTHVCARYQTSWVSGPSATPPRVQYDADAPPRLQIFHGGTPPQVQSDSTLAPGAVFNGNIPYTTAVEVSPIDGYPVPVPTFVLIPVGFAGPELTFQPGEQFTIRIQYFNVPYPQGVEAGYTTSLDSTSLTGATGIPFDLLRTTGFGQPDSRGADGIQDTWVIRPLTDNAFVAAEETPAAREVVLGAPSPNPAAGEVHVPFAIRTGGAVRLSLLDVTGRLVSVVAERVFPAGSHVATVDTSRLAAGVYALVLDAGGVRATQRLSVTR